MVEVNYIKYYCHLVCSHSIARLERDLKQKKQLIADQRQKLCRLEQGTATDKDKIVGIYIIYTPQYQAIIEFVEEFNLVD